MIKFKNKTINNIDSNSISNVFGTILLLGILVIIFSMLYTIILSQPLEVESPYPNLIASIEGDYIVITHNGGNDLSLDSNISFDVGLGQETNGYIEDLNGDGSWNIGEKYYAYFDLLPNVGKISIIY